ncbi:endonuclease domain-containing protein [Methylobacterium mesophilicum]
MTQVSSVSSASSRSRSNSASGRITMASPEGVRVLTMVTGSILAVDRAARGNGEMRSAKAERTRFRRHLRLVQTEAERRLWYRLRDRRLAGFKFVRQESIGRYVADFCCREARLIVEIDGSQHADNVRDRIRDEWLAAQGYHVLRFWNPEIADNIGAVLDTILAALPPSPRVRGEDRDDLVVAGARRQPRVRGRLRMSLIRSRPLTSAPASPALPARTTRSMRASPRARGEGTSVTS